MLKLLPELKTGDILELGSGWGTLAIALARHYPSCQVLGYEISPIPYLFSKLLAQVLFLPNLRLMRQDFFPLPLQHASLIVCYLYPEAMERLKIKFEQELLPGTWILTHTFALPGWKPIRMEHTDDLYRTPIYLYCK